MIDRLIIVLVIAFASGVHAGDLIIQFDEDVSLLSVRLYTKEPSTADVVSIDDQADPSHVIYPNVSAQGRVTTFINVPAGPCWVTIEDSDSSWDRNYIDVRKIGKTDSNQTIKWHIPDGVIEVAFRGKQDRVIIKLERRINGKLDGVFQKWLILGHDRENGFSGRFTHVGEDSYVVSFYEYSVNKGLGDFICSCSATRSEKMNPRANQ